MTSDLRAALKVLALANPPGTPVNLTLVREDLLELVDGNGARHETPAGPDRLMTVADAARRCALSPRYIYAHADRLPFIKRTGRKVLVSEARLARWIERRPGQAGGR